MKTQISQLINGSKDVRRDLTNSKYLTANKGTSFADYAGTNSVERTEIAGRVRAENPERLLICVFGLELTLPISTSISGLSFRYTAHISEEQFMLIAGYKLKPFGSYEGEYSISVNGNMTVQVDKFARKNSESKWEHRGWDFIGEEFVTIL